MRTRSLLTAVAVLPVLAVIAVTGGCRPQDDGYRGPDVRQPCTPHTPADPVVLTWSEDIDNAAAQIAGIAPPALEVMADGRVIADAVRVEVLSPAQIAALRDRIRTDLAAVAGPRSVLLTRDDGYGGQNREEITVWPPGRPLVSATVLYNPPLPATRAPVNAPPSISASTARTPQPSPTQLDTGLTGGLRQAVDELTALRQDVLAHGAAYQSARVDLLLTPGETFTELVGDTAAISTAATPWPSAIPTIPPYQGQSSEYDFQHQQLTAAQAAAAKTLFVEYLTSGATARGYDDGRPNDRLWYGLWRPMLPTEIDTSAVPVVCPTATPHPTPTASPS